MVISACAGDSTHCRVVWTEQVATAIPAGGASTFSVPWHELGDVVFSAIIDPDTTLIEQSRANNTHLERLRSVSRKGVVVYPNPVRIDDDGKQQLTFTGLPRKSTVNIFTPSGELIWTREEGREEEIGEVIWKGVNDRGFLISSGIYLYNIILSDGKIERTGKIAVVR